MSGPSQAELLSSGQDPALVLFLWPQRRPLPGQGGRQGDSKPNLPSLSVREGWGDIRKAGG